MIVESISEHRPKGMILELEADRAVKALMSGEFVLKNKIILKEVNKNEKRESDEMSSMF